MAENYDKDYGEDEALFGAKPSHLLEQCADLLPEGCRVLDLGIGQGRNALPLARRGCRVTGIDTSQVAVDTVNRLAAEEDLPVEALLEDFRTFEPPKNFDAVLCFGLMQTLDLAGCASLVERLHHWTRPGGALFLVTWHVQDPGFDRYVQEWERRSARSFRSPDGDAHRLFLDKGEVLQLFFRWEVVHHWEGMGKPHEHATGKKERHGEVEAVIIRPKK